MQRRVRPEPKDSAVTSAFRFRDTKIKKYILPNREFPNLNASLDIRGHHPEAP
jgi:hypothetical protein